MDSQAANSTGAEQPYPKSLLGSLILLVTSIFFKLYNQLDADYDLWWHIFFGQENLAKGTVETFDVYSFTASGQLYINHEWLSEIFLGAIYGIGGQTALIIWRWCMVLAILWFGFRLIRRKAQNDLNKIIIFLLFGLTLSPGISFRIHLFSYLFLLILMNLIDASLAEKKFPPVVPVSILLLLWANFHGAFILGLGIWFVYTFENFFLRKPFRTDFIAILALLLPGALTIVNPYGAGLWYYIAEVLVNNPLSSQYITEWQRFSFAPREIPFFIVFVLTWLAYFTSGKEKKFSETILLILASAMGLAAVRNTPLFVILSLPCMADHIDAGLRRLYSHTRRTKPVSDSMALVSAIGIVCLSFFFFVKGVPDRWQIVMDKDPLPVQTVSFIKANDLKGNLWVPLHYGGYVLFHLYPGIRVSIDGRMEMVYPRDVVKATMTFAYQGTRKKWKKILHQYGADFALVEKDNPAVAEMEADPDWFWLFAEKDTALLVRKAYITSAQRTFQIPPKKPFSFP
ncbi:hypothetical protein ACFL9U_05760 [Thermodesulfobacteriota bacterium]